MQHELLHHFIHTLSQNIVSGLARSVLLKSSMSTKQLRCTPSHPTDPLSFAYHDILTQLHDADITHFQAICSISSVGDVHQHQDSFHDHIVAVAHIFLSRSPSTSCRRLTLLHTHSIVLVVRPFAVNCTWIDSDSPEMMPLGAHSFIQTTSKTEKLKHRHVDCQA
jgi:hypothetical protein